MLLLSDLHSFFSIYLVEMHVFLLQADVAGIPALCTGSCRRRGGWLVGNRRRVCWVGTKNIAQAKQHFLLAR